MPGIDFADQAADRIILGEPQAAVQLLAMELAVAGHCSSLADQRELTMMLGLDPRQRRRRAPAPRSGRSAGHARRTVGKARR